MKPSFAKLLRPRRASDSDVICTPASSVTRDGASSGLSHSIRRLIPSFGRKSSNARIVTPYTYVSPAGFNATTSRPKQVVAVETEMARMESVLTAPEFTDPRPAPATPPGPRFTDSTIRSTVSDPEVLDINGNGSLEYIKKLQGASKARHNVQGVTWNRPSGDTSGMDGLNENLARLGFQKDPEVPCIEVIDDEPSNCGELVFVNRAQSSQDSPLPMDSFTIQMASRGSDAKKRADNLKLLHNKPARSQVSDPSVASGVPVKASLPPQAAAPATAQNEPNPGACTCTICERAKKQAAMEKLSEEEQLQLALSRSIDEYVMPSYEAAALRGQAAMVN